MKNNVQTKPTLIIGAGISGITTAVELAEAGKEVILIEQKAYLGGNVVKMNSYFPKLCPPSCGLEINFRRIRQNPRIKFFTSSTVSEISGTKGNFSVQLKTTPQYVKNVCTSCGECTNVCPEERADEFNSNFSKTKAIYLPHEMAFPMKFNIDEEYCKKEACNKCAKVCDYNAIDFAAEAESTSLEVGSIIVATGWHSYDAEKIETLAYSTSENIVTNIEFERLLASTKSGEGKLKRPVDQKEVKEIVFVQCAGSRDENHLPYCSSVCCSASLKHALSIQALVPDCKVSIYYIDLRVSGRNEDFLEKVKQTENIQLVKGKVGRIEEEIESKDLLVEVEDILKGKKIKHTADLVVLATGIVPNALPLYLATSAIEFLSDDQQEGIYAVGCSRKPMDVSSSVKEATAVALKAIQST